jgi:GNAT superfamily N-acetyltransferase
VRPINLSCQAHSGDSLIEIRLADPSDHVAPSAIRRRAILELAVAAMSPSQAKLWANQAAADRVTRAILHRAVWVAVQSVPIGWVEVDDDRVAALYVVPHCAGRGVGSRLLFRAEAAIRDGGYTAARLETSPNAKAFYLHRGYVSAEARTANGALLLSKRLPSMGLIRR